MGSILKLSLTEQHPFRHALKRLHRDLSDPLKFEACVQGGVTRIVLIADETRSRQFRKYFAPTCITTGVGGRKLKKPKVIPHPLVTWVAEKQKEYGVMTEVHRERGFMSVATPPGEREDEVRRAFTLLRDTLADKKKRRALAEIGPCALSLWDPEDIPPEPDEYPSILIYNHIPGCMPNADYSIIPDGARRDMMNGICYHS